MDKITSVAIPLALVDPSLFLIPTCERRISFQISYCHVTTKSSFYLLPRCLQAGLFSLKDQEIYLFLFHFL
ncbi:hypothetical protein L1987_21847 [Smallanthus sonchifolius]|uniref:Uncharacterized protein n=1 Tax=Smallanthus sonchifolius TaxID=185202 RepID=A0ACB9ICI2_9ASTR|nr:hypothetical protein L1987_21847 [Smallanthus sonchifolius]